MDAVSACISGQDVRTERSEIRSSSPCAKYSPVRSSLSVNVCFSLCQTDRSETNGNTRGKWNDILCSLFFIPFPNSLQKLNLLRRGRACQNVTANFGPNGVKGQTGTPPEVALNIPIGPNRPDHSIWLLTEIFGSFGIMEGTQYTVSTYN